MYDNIHFNTTADFHTPAKKHTAFAIIFSQIKGQCP